LCDIQRLSQRIWAFKQVKTLWLPHVQIPLQAPGLDPPMVCGEYQLVVGLGHYYLRPLYSQVALLPHNGELKSICPSVGRFALVTFIGLCS